MVAVTELHDMHASVLFRNRTGSCWDPAAGRNRRAGRHPPPSGHTPPPCHLGRTAVGQIVRRR